METERLAVIPLFGGLDGADLEAIAAAATEVEAAEGQTLVTEGDFGHALYAIESGTADVNANGATVVSARAGRRVRRDGSARVRAPHGIRCRNLADAVDRALQACRLGPRAQGAGSRRAAACV